MQNDVVRYVWGCDIQSGCNIQMNHSLVVYHSRYGLVIGVYG